MIKKIAEGIPRSGEGLIQGIDDDAAVIEGPRGVSWLVTTDILAEGVHFQREWANWKTLGEKALLINISDIAAMGGIPWFYFVSVGCPGDVSEGDLDAFFEGMKSIAEKNDMILAGGDTTASASGLFVSVAVVGSADNDRILYRRGARPGDGVYVSGLLGGSAAGLICLEKGIKDKKYSHLVDRHLLPRPRLDLSCWLAKNRCATAMIDISDGFKADLDHVAEQSGVGYKVYADRVPADEGVDDVAADTGTDLLELVLAGGEDYEVLFTMNAEQEERFFSQASKIDFGCNVTRVGEIVSDKNTRVILDKDGGKIRLARSGFVHQVGKELD